MEKELVIALGSSLASLLVALIALWQANRTTKRQVAAQKAIASLQAASESLKPQLASISEAWAEIQRIKHALDLCRSAGDHDNKAALAILDAAVDALVSRYERHGVELPEYLRVVWHEAKNYGISLRAGVRLQLRDRTTDAHGSSASVEWLTQARATLTSLQTHLEEGRERLRRDEVDGTADLLRQAESRAASKEGAT